MEDRMKMTGLKRTKAVALAAALVVALVALVSWGRHALSVVIYGAKGKVGLSQPVKLTSTVKWRGPRAKLSYQWSSVSGPSLPFDGDTAKPKLVIPKDELQPGESYHIRLRVTAEYEDPDADPPSQTAVATSDAKFEVNAPPSGGSCKLEATWLGKATGRFRIAAPGWTDEDKQVHYRYELSRNGKTHLVDNWSQDEAITVTAKARPGDKIKANCHVRDKLGDAVVATSNEVERPQASD